MRTPQGFTIVEITITLMVMSVLVSVLFIFVKDSQSRARDKERQSDIDTLHARLGEYYHDFGAYPSSLTAATFSRLDPAVLIAPNGTTVRNDTPVNNQATARVSTDPTASSSQYTYTPYPTSCSNNCVGYILKAYIERPTAQMPNPYIRGGVYNN